MALRNYSNNAPPQALTVSLAASGGATTATVASTSGYPSPPFIVGLERGTSNQEVALCTGTTGTTLTLVRGYDGTTALLHNIGATLEHTSAAIDYREANAFVNLLSVLGDILVMGPGGPVNLSIGANGQSLVADSSQTNGLAWEQVIAPGIVLATATSGAPAGWLLCQGQPVSRSTYINLWNALGTTGSPWGQGDGSTTFNVPNLQGMTIVGVGTGSDINAVTKAITLGTKYGEYVHTLSLAEIAAHNHTGSGTTSGQSNGHDHSFPDSNILNEAAPPYSAFQFNWTGINQYNFVAINNMTTGGPNADHSHTYSFTTNTQGSNSPHNNFQPSVGLNWLIKV